MSYLHLRRRKSLWEHACTLARRITRYSGPYYIVRWRKLWRYDRARAVLKGSAICEVGGEGWPTWVREHDRLMWQDKHGSAILKRETYRRRLRSGEVAVYSYWRAYRWPWRRKPPVRVHIGCLERLSYDELATLMRELAGRYEKKRSYYRAERESRRAKRRSASKHRWYLRYRERQRQDRMLG